MNLNSNDIEREEVLHRYFREELTTEERTEVEVWRDASQENQGELEKARIMHLDLKGLAFYKNANLQEVDRSWEQFKKDKKIKSIHQEPIRSFTWMKYAASIVLLLSTALAIYYYGNNVEEITLASIEGVREVTLPDGSLVALNERASIEYPEPFQNNERRIKLSGEAYFEVTKRSEQPFVVEVGNTEVRVLGTKFFINKPSANELSIQVDEGKVLISHKDTHQIAEAGQQFTLDLQTETLLETEDETGVSSFWKNRRLVFQVTSLEDVVAVINEAYGSSIQLEGSTERCSLTVTFDNEDLENVLEVISSTLNYELIEDQGSYILKGTGCE
ncbi:MAG: FecR domain-containing protein [Cyclobacteriaceae bacterium]